MRRSWALILATLVGCQQTPVEQCPPVVRPSVRLALEPSDFDRLREAPLSNADRQRLAWRYLELAGCDTLLEQRILGSSRRNLVCQIGPDVGAQTVVGAHYDKVAPGHGIADNWSGIIVLARLATHLASTDAHAPTKLIAFGEEEPGLMGSSHFVRLLGDTHIAAMVNVDTLGMGPLVIDPISDPGLACVARNAAGALEIPTLDHRLMGTIGDWAPFKRRGIPVLNFHSMRRKDLRRIHSSKDDENLVDWQSLNDAYLVILNSVLGVLDRSHKEGLN